MLDEDEIEKLRTARVLVETLAKINNRSIEETSAYRAALSLLADHLAGEFPDQ